MISGSYNISDDDDVNNGVGDDILEGDEDEDDEDEDDDEEETEEAE